MTAALDAASSHNLQDRTPELLRRAFACSGSGILVTELAVSECPIVFANPAFYRMTGYCADEVIGKDSRFLQKGDRDQPALQILRNAIAEGRDASVVIRNYRKDGSIFWNHLHISPMTSEDGTITHYVGVLRDVTAETRYEELLIRRTMYDPLTNLPNRQFTADRLTTAICGADGETGSVGLIVMDIDNFKLINDSFSYSVGDQILKTVAERLRHAVSGQEFLLRHGVDEFGVIFRGAAREAEALSVTLSRAVSEPLVFNGERIHLACSVGIALCPQDGSNAWALIQSADMALHRAKELGGGNVQFFSRDLKERVEARMSIEAALRGAVDKEELQLHYQPQVDLQTGRISGFEALLRWTSATLGTIAPVRFIGIAEECGLIEAIGEWALERACRDIRRWADAGLRDIRVAVNVSPRQFRNPDLADRIARIISASGIEASQLSLEVTESLLMQDTPLARATLTRIRAMGIEFALDDFGTGYSSLGYLKRYPFSKVKIDRSFIENVAVDSDDAAIAKAAISMAHSLGIQVVAEGVETEVQCDFLRRNMCDEIQGYLFSAAVPASEVEKMLQEGRSLPAHLLRFVKPQRTLLLVDDEENILAALKRLLRREGYAIVTANSAPEGLAILERQAIDVIVSDQRMPEMTGVEFLSKVKEVWPDTIRIVLSGYTELQSVTEAVNKGAIYKFLTKPWDDTLLRTQIAEAFRQKELGDENRRLNVEVQTANFQLAASNRRLAEVLEQQRQLLLMEQVSLDVVREVLQHMPTPAIGLDDDGIVAFLNAAAQQLFAEDGLQLGGDAGLAIPLLIGAIDEMTDAERRNVQLKNTTWRVNCHHMGQGSQSRGRMITLFQDKAQT
jgi:diguanylate cyclase (GGDEF)-like protein/PAS domain S-box-containing protein